MSFHRLILLLIASSLTQMVDLSAQTTPAGGTATAGGASVSGAGSANPSLTPPDQLDTDGDGLTDWDEVNRTGSDPKEGKADTDGDGVSDLTDGWPRTPWLHPARLPEVRYAVVRLYALGWPTDIMGRETREIDDYCDVLSTPISTHDPHANSFNFRFWNARTCSIETTPWTWVNEGAPHPFSSSDNPYYFPIKRLGRNGHVIDFVNDYSSYLKRAVVWTTGSAAPTQLEPTDYSDSNIGSIASAVDGAGHVVGFRVEYTNDPDPYTGTIYSGGVTFGDTVSWLGGAKITEASSNNGYDWTTSGTDYEPVAINESGLIAASRSIIDYDSGRTPDEILTDPDVGILDGNTFTSLGSGTITAITSGIPVVAVGYTQDYKMWWAHQDTASHAWIRETVQVWNLSTQQLETIPSSYPYGTRINDRLEMLVDGGYIVRNGVIRSLTDLMPSGWSYVGARDINNHGVILANPTRTQDDQGQPIANPQPEPVLLVPAAMEVDENRDGSIDDKDLAANTATTPFRFWINDDDDGNALNNEQEVYGGTAKDYESRGDFGISSRRDLEDFARLHLYIGGLTEAVTSGTLKIGLKWKEGTVTGSPAINLYKQVETDGGQKYLTDDTTAIAQTTPPYSTTLIDLTGKLVIDTSGVFILKPELFANLSSNKTTYFLFEGAGVGKGMLQMVILDQNNNIIGEGPGTWIDLQSILSMYQRVKVTPRDPNGIPKPYQSSTTFDASTAGTEQSDDAHPFQAPPDETKSALVFVHGSNISYGEAEWNAETMFKRLYWQGYKGRFVLFYWDTLVGAFNGEIPALPFDLNEYRSLKYGTALKNYVATLSQGRTVNVTSHSLGAGVVLSALKAGMTVNNYLILQGAMSAKCYNANLATLQKFQDAENINPTPDLADKLGYGGYLSGVTGTVINMFNPDDFALATGTVFLYGDANWEENQRISKPDDPVGMGQYFWFPEAYFDLLKGGSVTYNLGPARAVTDPHESMAFIARTRTKAVGAMAGVGGVISQEVKLNDNTYGFGDTRSDHSAEFTRRVQEVQAFYRTMFEKVR